MKYFRILFFFFFPLSLFCEPFDPIAIYLTWQHSPESTMTIQWITRNDDQRDLVEYKTQNQTDWNSSIGMHLSFPDNYPYFVHRVELTNLQPDTQYSFRPGPEGIIYQFKTLPKDLSKPVQFVVGGDVYHDGINSVIEMNRIAAKTNPAFAIVGGDIAYAETNPWDDREPIVRWMDFIVAWKKSMITPQGCLIPIVPTIGNHDVKGGFWQTPKEAQFFYTLFATPESQGYYVLDFANNACVIILDTDHTHSIGGEQSHWLYHALEDRQHFKHKFAVYHIGAYPSYRRYSEPYSHSVRKYWVPVFDHFHLDAAFENHDHTYKRTHLLRHGKIDRKGVLYLGDGCWGVETPRIPATPEQRWYLAHTVSVQHVILVTIDNMKRQYQAIDKTGQIIDQITQVVNSE